MSKAPKKEYLCFSVTGEFVTKTARSWLYEEKRPYSIVLKFLLSAMCGTRHKEKTLIKFANDVLTGKKKFIGTTKNDSFCLIKDDLDILSAYPLYFENAPEIKNIIKQEKNNETYNTKMVKIRKYQSFLNNNITKNDYGWLSPEGKFYPVGWGDHESWARDYIEKHFKLDVDAPFFYSGNFLVKNRWLLLHNPCMGAIELSKDEIINASKKQKEYLYDYFMEREMFEEAQGIWKE